VEVLDVVCHLGECGKMPLTTSSITVALTMGSAVTMGSSASTSEIALSTFEPRTPQPFDSDLVQIGLQSYCW
jgi:hypothetical protein